MAASTTLLAWGLLEYKDAYEQSGQLEYMYDCIRWPLEWMLKCHTGHNELYVQVIVQKHTQNATYPVKKLAKPCKLKYLIITGRQKSVGYDMKVVSGYAFLRTYYV